MTHRSGRPCLGERRTCHRDPWIPESELSPLRKPRSFFLITDLASCFLPATLSLKVNHASSQPPPAGPSVDTRLDGMALCAARSAGPGSAIASFTLSCDLYEALVRFLIVRGRCFPTSSKLRD